VLLDMLKNNHHFQQLPLTQQDIFARLAQNFEDNPLALYLTPVELSQKLNVGSKQNWNDFLNTDVVRNYIKTHMAQQAQIAQRKAFKSLTESALDGNVQAAKEINELSGIMNQSDQNKTIILHRIDDQNREVKTMPFLALVLSTID
jgi:hypothetical protein